LVVMEKESLKRWKNFYSTKEVTKPLFFGKKLPYQGNRRKKVAGKCLEKRVFSVGSGVGGEIDNEERTRYDIRH